MLNFAVGPVMSDEDILNIGGQQVPYFRTQSFSSSVLESEDMIKKIAGASDNSRACFITGSGTAAMEAVVINCFGTDDNVLIVNGGSFGARFIELCEIHRIPYTEIKLESGKTLTQHDLDKYEGYHYTGFIVNIHETSTGVYYDPLLISKYCRKYNLFLVVDAISSFLADPFKMKEWGVNVMLTGSQKALAVAPGVSIVVMDEIAIKRIESKDVLSLYFDLKRMIKDGQRGQTPFTPAVSVLLQIHERLKKVIKYGVENEIERIHSLAKDFRTKIQALPLEFYSDNMSNATTALLVSSDKDAYRVFEVLEKEYNIWICPNGGELKNKVFRVGHMGALTIEDNTILVNALEDLYMKGII